MSHTQLPPPSVLFGPNLHEKSLSSSFALDDPDCLFSKLPAYDWKSKLGLTPGVRAALRIVDEHRSMFPIWSVSV